MSNQQGDNPPSAAPAGAYGPGHTLLGEPAFVEEAAPAAFPPPATPAAPRAGAMVPATMVDPGAACVPPPQYPVSPYAGGAAPAAGFAPPGGPTPPTVGYNTPAPNPYGAPPPPAYPAPPPRVAAGATAGPPMILIGVAAFVVIGGLTTFLALRGRSSGESSDKPIPTLDVPPVATVPSDPGPGAGTGADPTEPPPADPPTVAPPAAAAPAHPTPKPTATAPKATTPTPTATTKSTATAPTSAPTPTSPPAGKPRGTVIIPRHPIPKTR
jgi:hypothetical protein